MKKTFATAAFTAIFSAVAACHGAFAQTAEAELTSEDLGAKVAAQTVLVSQELNAKIENLDVPYADKLAAMGNHQPGRVRMAENTRKQEAEVIVLAMAN